MSTEPVTLTPGPLVGVDWLACNAAHVVVLDASIAPHLAEDRHIPGARRFDIDGEFSDPDSDLPHSMPPAAFLQERLRAIGINSSSTVVVYDAAGIYSAPRAWWMLRAAGLERVAVLDGGLPAWEAAGQAVEPGRADYDGAAGDVVVSLDADAFVDAEVVAAQLAGEGGAAVVDARSSERFAGEAAEPRPGLRAGHVAGSANLPFASLLRDGKMISVPELRQAFERVAPGVILGQRELITSCGSGVTACVLALAAELAGEPRVRVYDGSWADWGRPDPKGVRPIETGA
ncbi:sulfurtransferase [Zhihengliuella flava]|uniref:Thiosulfate/3-mercaptopyruvate sulfurtransferase n=1 Tax=Zhihengliuella flava TaxID=1285193 RepID=A0A931DD03_9MICC|nr:sulfurtransferase [Zhihengliuella flava]MBG6084593.1 thiosulfate/3-mercaptopyruvate sulfurtransferase [Zhihengliuella flava]